MPVLSEEHYDAIRKAIAVELDADDLPDTTISLSIYLGAAERWAAAADPDIDTRQGAELEAAQNAVIFKCASLLVPAVPFLEQESFAVGEGFRRQRVDKEELAQTLAVRAQAELDSYLAAGSSTGATYLPVFCTAPGYRGR